MYASARVKRLLHLPNAARPEEHMQRVIDQADLRPILGNEDAMSDLRRILEQRTLHYKQAHAELRTSDESIEECVDELTRMFEEEPSRRPLCTSLGS